MHPVNDKHMQAIDFNKSFQTSASDRRAALLLLNRNQRLTTRVKMTAVVVTKGHQQRNQRRKQLPLSRRVRKAKQRRRRRQSPQPPDPGAKERIRALEEPNRKNRQQVMKTFQQRMISIFLQLQRQVIRIVLQN